MKRTLTVAVVCLAASPLAAQSAGQAAALKKVSADFAAAFNAKDAAKVAATYTEDAVLMPPNGPMVRGRANIEAFWKGMFDQFSDVSLTSMEASSSGNIGFDAGTYSGTVKPASGPAMTDKGKFLVVLKRAGGRWLAAYDIWNSDMPAAPPTK